MRRDPEGGAGGEREPVRSQILNEDPSNELVQVLEDRGFGLGFRGGRIEVDLDDMRLGGIGTAAETDDVRRRRRLVEATEGESPVGN